MKMIYPVFAMVEDENPPAYEPVSLNDESGEDGIPRNGFRPTNGQPRTVTSSFRAINRLLMANGGFKAYFRGFFCFLAQVFLTTILVGIFTGSLGRFFMPVATLLASLALVQFSAAWVHIVISERSPLHFWSRLPPFKRTFDATWQAVTIYWFACEVARFFPLLFASLLGLNVFSSKEPINLNEVGIGYIIKVIVFWIVSLGVCIFAIVPAYVVLVRVQASVIPVETSTIIPFDRSFEGRVEPEVVGGKGYATVADAWKSFGKAAWRRLLTVYVKLFCLSVASSILLVVVLVPQFFLIMKHSKQVKQ